MDSSENLASKYPLIEEHTRLPMQAMRYRSLSFPRVSSKATGKEESWWVASGDAGGRRSMKLDKKVKLNLEEADLVHSLLCERKNVSGQGMDDSSYRLLTRLMGKLEKFLGWS